MRNAGPFPYRQFVPKYWICQFVTSWYLFLADKMPLDAMNIIVHAINSVIMLIDVWIVSHPIRILHFYWPMLLGICYVIFNFIYYVAGGTSR